MITAITDQNRAQIIEICGSTLVCLKIILADEHIETKLSQFMPFDNPIRTKNDIISKINDLLTGDDYAVARVHLPRFLPDYAIFKARLSLVQDLDPALLHTSNELIQALIECEIGFIEQFRSLYVELDENTRHACEFLINKLPALTANHKHAHGTITYCNTYEDHHHDHDHDHDHDHHHHHHRNLCCPGFEIFKQRIAHAMPRFIIDGMYGVQNMFWSFTAGVQYTAHRISAAFVGEAAPRERNTVHME